eukprot:TRINITY_DN17780_c0_g1_i1.p1 TRINITY_DN17780_c0_g1~~TRINITY_DN17780_c0_g1_i1.p1  ORF type:complete len:311 (+),score=65.73 TRINITY_DN17780_c0_g1_i1:110-1042(+)
MLSQAVAQPGRSRAERRRAAQASMEQALKKFKERASQAEQTCAHLQAVIGTLEALVQGRPPASLSTLSRRLLAIAPALHAQEQAAACGMQMHSPRRLLPPQTHLQQVAAKHLFPLPGEQVWHALPTAELKSKLRGTKRLREETASRSQADLSSTVASAQQVEDEKMLCEQLSSGKRIPLDAVQRFCSGPKWEAMREPAGLPHSRRVQCCVASGPPNSDTVGADGADVDLKGFKVPAGSGWRGGSVTRLAEASAPLSGSASADFACAQDAAQCSIAGILVPGRGRRWGRPVAPPQRNFDDDELTFASCATP